MYWISPGSCGITFRKMFIRALALIFRRRLTGAALLIGLSMAHGVSAQEPAPKPVSSSSEVFIPGRDFQLRPEGRPADILRLVPGFVISQHQGGGKAEQYFLRGFDADHGTDVALYLDGLPVNLRSHAHGQGYADLHFLIPETVQR